MQQNYKMQFNRNNTFFNLQFFLKAKNLLGKSISYAQQLPNQKYIQTQIVCIYSQAKAIRMKKNKFLITVSVSVRFHHSGVFHTPGVT